MNFICQVHACARLYGCIGSISILEACTEDLSISGSMNYVDPHLQFMQSPETSRATEDSLHEYSSFLHHAKPNLRYRKTIMKFIAACALAGIASSQAFMAQPTMKTTGPSP